MLLKTIDPQADGVCLNGARTARGDGLYGGTAKNVTRETARKPWGGPWR